MEDSQNRTKAVQYWSYVYDGAAVLFNSPIDHNETLKSLIETVLNTKLISEIECLSEEVDEEFPFPLTAWLLEGIYRTSIVCAADVTSQEFYIESQTKMIEATSQRSVYEYVRLVKLVFGMVHSICEAELGGNFFYLIKKSCKFTNVVVNPKPFVIASESQRLVFLDVLLKVLYGTNETLLYCCSLESKWKRDRLDGRLWGVVKILIDLESPDVIIMALPLLSCMVAQLPLDTGNEDFPKIFSALPTVLNHNAIIYPSRKQEFLKVWGLMRDSLKLSSNEAKNVIRKLSSLKKSCRIEDFVPVEMGYLTQFLDSEFKQEILTETNNWGLYDKVMFLENSIESALRYYLKVVEKEQNGSTTVVVEKICHDWADLIPLVRNATSAAATSFGRIKSLQGMLSTISQILGHLDQDRILWTNQCVLLFLPNDFLNIFNCIVAHLTSSENEIVQIAADALAMLMNLPEAVNAPEFNFSDILKLLSKMKTENPLKVKLLRSLQNVPRGLSTPLIHFGSVMKSFEANVEGALQAIGSVPFLCQSQKVSPAQLIAEVLMPGMLSGRDNIQLAVLDAAASLICVTAGTSYILRKSTGMNTFDCRECLNYEEPVGFSGKVSQIELHLIKLLQPVFTASSSVRRKYLAIFPKLSRHMKQLHSLPTLKPVLLLIRDPDVTIRQDFANVVNTVIFGEACVVKALKNTLNDEDIPAAASQPLDLFFTIMEEEINTKLSTEQWGEDLQCMLTILTNVACFPVRRVQLRSIKLMLTFVGNCPLPLSSLASSMAAAHKTSSLALYYAYKSELSLFFGELLINNHVRFGCPPALTLSSIILFFNGLSKVRFASSSEQYLIPVIVAAVAKQEASKRILSDYSEYIEISLPVIITRCFQNIFVHIWLTETSDVFEASMKMIEQLINVQVPDLIMHSQKMIIHLFLFNYHINEDKVLLGLKRVLNLGNGNVKELVAFNLESRFVGFLLFLVGKFTKEGSAEREKVQALECLSSVLGLMGRRRVTPVSRKVLATLQTTLSLNLKELSGLQCKAWEAFIRSVEPKQIGPLLATIVVSILPFLEYEESTVLRMLNHLLVEHKTAVADFLPTITFLPKKPVLQKINDHIRAYVSFQNEDIKERLTRETALALHETVGVRLEGLKALLKTLETHSSDVQSLIDGSDDPDPCVTALWDALVTCCRDEDKQIALSAARCLGELGALDPSLLPRKLKPWNTLPLSVHNPEFGFLALCEIVRGFQNARTSVDMDAFAIGIQELLKIYSVVEKDDNAMWKRFSALEQSLLRPMLTSRYKVQAPARTVWPEVIFGTKEATSHMRWAALWASKLIVKCTDSKAVVLFRACEPSIKRDPKVLLFFLQYILLHVLTQDSAEHGLILKEILAVLSWSPSVVQPQASSIPIRLIESYGYPLLRSSITDTDARACSMTVFLLIDFLQYWSRFYLSIKATPNGDHLRNREYVLIKDFLAKINLVKIAEANFELQEYPRAIQCWEDLSRNQPEILSDHLSMLSKAYARYSDMDSVVGARALQTCASDASDQLFYHQVSRKMEEARILYEQLGKNGIMSASEIEGMVLCYLRLGESATALSHIQKNMEKPPEMSVILTESLSECLTKLGDWGSLETFLKSNIASGEKSWYTQLGRVTLDLEQNKFPELENHITETRAILVDNFKALGVQSGNEYQGYHCLLRLQILNEVEKVRDFMLQSTQEKPQFTLPKLFKHWDAKLTLVQSDTECLEHILSTRRTLLTVLSKKITGPLKQSIKTEIGKYWVNSADIARKDGCFHQAYNYVLSAEPFNIPHTFIQKVQLLWDKGDKEGSLTTLTRGLSSYFPDAEAMKSLPPDERLEDRKMTAEAKLLYAVYNEKTSNCSSYTNMSNYQDAYDVCKQLEKTQALLAKCLDRGLRLVDEAEQGSSKACDLRVMIVSNFGKSLMNGCEYIYQSVPRMLMIWLDLGENLSTDERKTAMTKINKLIQIYSDKLPPFILMTALPQLLSRICHPNREVFLLLKAILVKLIRAFPQQCLWAIQTLAKSAVPQRSMRYKEVIQDPKLQSMKSVIDDFTSLCDKLNRLTNKNLPQDSTSKGIMVSTVVRELPLLFNSDRFSRIIIPITRFCAISIPKNLYSASHHPFPKNPVTISGIKNEMTVLPSLQRPRKITFVGSDGKPYDILCKPKDDLRRDARLMEFNNIVNMYLHRDPESRARHLHIRTYVVTPIGENGGLLEWVPNLVGLRPALLALYRQHGKNVTTRELRKHELQSRDSLERKRTVFLENLLPMYPPIFHEWFRLTFPDPAGWYAARQAFTRTTAVMSMVGYILGLGDRHGENILFDSESGDTVHVDFNCLFNKGENFDWKERVPFRLTHNMISAMGPCGVEGAFRKSCEVSMRVLRAQERTLMSVLTPFAHDPLGSWSKNIEIVQQERAQKIDEALGELSDIEKRLKGSLRVKQKNNNFHLSVEGLVRSLITEATSVDNLCQMYLGWGAYL